MEKLPSGLSGDAPTAAPSATLPAIPAKRYFTIGEVSALCNVKPYVLRYWEQEFAQLKPMKRRGNRRYYQHHEVLLIRRIRELLYEHGFTISGARNRLSESGSGGLLAAARALGAVDDAQGSLGHAWAVDDSTGPESPLDGQHLTFEAEGLESLDAQAVELIRSELLAIRQLLD